MSLGLYANPETFALHIPDGSRLRPVLAWSGPSASCSPRVFAASPLSLSGPGAGQ